LTCSISNATPSIPKYIASNTKKYRSVNARTGSPELSSVRRRTDPCSLVAFVFICYLCHIFSSFNTISELVTWLSVIEPYPSLFAQPRPCSVRHVRAGLLSLAQQHLPGSKLGQQTCKNFYCRFRLCGQLWWCIQHRPVELLVRQVEPMSGARLFIVLLSNLSSLAPFWIGASAITFFRDKGAGSGGNGFALPIGLRFWSRRPGGNVSEGRRRCVHVIIANQGMQRMRSAQRIFM